MSRRVECPTFIADACLPKMKLVPISRLNKILSLDYNIAKNKEKKTSSKMQMFEKSLENDEIVPKRSLAVALSTFSVQLNNLVKKEALQES